MNVKGRVEFDKVLRTWDGFGINYVETCQTRNYAESPQDYGGFSTLDAVKRGEILELIFGNDGLRPGIAKMFLDCWHQAAPGSDSPIINSGEYDHETTTKWMRLFMREGTRITRQRGGMLNVFTGMYGPPGWMTRQNICRGRDLNPAFKVQCAKYIVSFAKYLRECEGIPVIAVGLHNEGEDWWRWPDDGTDSAAYLIHDYNMYWSPELVAEFIPLVRGILDMNAMQSVAVTPGETSFWSRFHTWGYADAIADDPAAMDALGMITSHGFVPAEPWASSRWFGDWRSAGTDILRALKPNLPAWVTSTSWSKMDARFVWELHNNIYSAQVNGIIPWACIQNHSLWEGGDPNPGCAFLVDGKGGYQIQPGYFYYKQVSRAGQPGMGVARMRSSESLLGIIGFSSNGTVNPDSLVVINLENETKTVDIEIRGNSAQMFTAIRTSPDEIYTQVDPVKVQDGVLTCVTPPLSVTTLTAG